VLCKTTSDAAPSLKPRSDTRKLKMCDGERYAANRPNARVSVTFMKKQENISG